MQATKNEINLTKEKRELTSSIQKKEDSLIKRKVKCVNCNRIVLEIDELIMGRVSVQCVKCGVKNGIDRTTTETGVGKYL